VTYDPERHHRRSIRLKGYDYAQEGTYFVTICVEGRRCLFGEVADDGTMCLNDCGQAVSESWLWLAQQYPHVQLDEFVVMPNHLHGLLTLTNFLGSSLRIDGRRPLGQIVGAFKTVSTKRLKLLLGRPDSKIWQRNYYEYVVRHERALERIRAYIFDNPASWQQDKLHPDVPSRW
jgi:putative transposase